MLKRLTHPIPDTENQHREVPESTPLHYSYFQAVKSYLKERLLHHRARQNAVQFAVRRQLALPQSLILKKDSQRAKLQCDFAHQKENLFPCSQNLLAKATKTDYQTLAVERKPYRQKIKHLHGFESYRAKRQTQAQPFFLQAFHDTSRTHSHQRHGNARCFAERHRQCTR